MQAGPYSSISERSKGLGICSLALKFIRRFTTRGRVLSKNAAAKPSQQFTHSRTHRTYRDRKNSAAQASYGFVFGVLLTLFLVWALYATESGESVHQKTLYPVGPEVMT